MLPQQLARILASLQMLVRQPSFLVYISPEPRLHTPGLRLVTKMKGPAAKKVTQLLSKRRWASKGDEIWHVL